MRSSEDSFEESVLIALSAAVMYTEAEILGEKTNAGNIDCAMDSWVMRLAWLGLLYTEPSLID